MELECTARLEILMAAAWPAVEREAAAGWIMRVRDGGGVPAAVGRLAVPYGAGGPGGVYCMATRPDARRRGYAGRVLM